MEKGQVDKMDYFNLYRWLKLMERFKLIGCTVHYFASPKFYKMVQVDRMVQVDKMGHFTEHRLTMQEASDSGLEAKLV